MRDKLIILLIILALGLVGTYLAEVYEFRLLAAPIERQEVVPARPTHDALREAVPAEPP